MNTPILEAIPLRHDAPQWLRAAPQDRPWMDDMPDAHAYRCLPLNIANTQGWQVVLPKTIVASWNGGPRREDLQVWSPDLEDADALGYAQSNFSRGILTFTVPFIFRTSPGWDLFVTGPINAPKRGASPLSAVIETSWLPYPFHMSWQITEENGYDVVFRAGEPITQFFPIPHGVLPLVTPFFAQPDEQLAADYRQWHEARAGFRARQEAGDADAWRQAWQRYYFKGQHPDGRLGSSDHINKQRLCPFTGRAGGEDGGGSHDPA